MLRDGKVLVTGCAAQCRARATELYDPQTGTFSLTGLRRAWDPVSTATLLRDGKVLLVVGNTVGSRTMQRSTAPATVTFTHIGYTSHLQEFSAAARLADGTVLIAGRQLAGGSGNPGTELYPATRTFAFVGNMTTAATCNTVTLLIVTRSDQGSE